MNNLKRSMHELRIAFTQVLGLPGLISERKNAEQGYKWTTDPEEQAAYLAAAQHLREAYEQLAKITKLSSDQEIVDKMDRNLKNRDRGALNKI